MHLSGLAAWEKTPSTRLIKAIGGSITEQFSRKNTHLICPCGTGLKCAKAVEWDIPIVDMSWLEATVRTGCIPSVQSSGESAHEPPMEEETSLAGIDAGDLAQPRVDHKGKGRAKLDAEATMLDITNGTLLLSIDHLLFLLISSYRRFRQYVARCIVWPSLC